MYLRNSAPMEQRRFEVDFPFRGVQRLFCARSFAPLPFQARALPTARTKWSSRTYLDYSRGTRLQ